jgi:hypothetical protein
MTEKIPYIKNYVKFPSIEEAYPELKDLTFMSSFGFSEVQAFDEVVNKIKNHEAYMDSTGQQDFSSILGGHQTYVPEDSLYTAALMFVAQCPSKVLEFDDCLRFVMSDDSMIKHRKLFTFLGETFAEVSKKLTDLLSE